MLVINKRTKRKNGESNIKVTFVTGIRCDHFTTGKIRVKEEIYNNDNKC